MKSNHCKAVKAVTLAEDKGNECCLWFLWASTACWI